MWESRARRGTGVGSGAGARDWVPAGRLVAATGQVSIKWGLMIPLLGRGLCGTKYSEQGLAPSKLSFAIVRL